jgi:hypothetical protein
MRITMTLEGPALDRVLLQLADAPWYDLRGGDFKTWQALNEKRRRSYKAALVSAVGELPPIPDVDLLGPYHRDGFKMFKRMLSAKTADQWARDLVASVKAMEAA